MWNNFIYSFGDTNAFALSLFVLIFSLAFILEMNFKYKKTSKHISYIGIFIAFIVVLNTCSIWICKFISPSGQIEVRIGDPIIFVVGMIFGPIIGIIVGISSDLITLLTTNEVGVFHFGFTINSCLLGFVGSLIFIFKKNKYWYINLTWIYFLSFFLITMFLDRLWLTSTYKFNAFILELLLIELVKSTIEYFIYLFIIIISFNTSFIFVSNKFKKLWCNRKYMIEILSKEKIFQKRKKQNKINF